MALTRPRFTQINTTITSITDPISILNNSATTANVDVGFLINRNQGISPNVAIFWDESANSFVTAFSSSSGGVDANLVILNYANIQAGTLFGNIGGGSVLPNVYITGSLLPSANVTYDLGSSTNRWRDAWFSGTTIYIGNESLSVNTAGVWSFTSNGSTLTLGSSTGFTAPSVTASGNISAANFLHSNGVPIFTTINTAITTANTNLKGYTDNLVTTANTNMKGYVDAANTIQSNQISAANTAITTANTNLKGYTDNLVTTANTNLKGYVDAANTIQSNQIAGANSAITTANTNMKGYVDGQISTTNTTITTANTNLKGYTDNLVTTANTNMKGYVDGQISTTTTAITTANTNMKGYVDAANTIQSNQISGANSAITTANTNMKGYVDGQISTTTTAITTANTNMKGYVDNINSTLTANAGAQAGSIADLYNIKANLAGPTFTGNVVFNSIGAIKLPSGTNAQRPTGVAGQIRFNSETNTFEGYSNAWAVLGSGGGSGGGTPGGSDTQIQFNDGGTVFSGAANLRYIKANSSIIADGGAPSTSTTTGALQVVGGVGITGNVHTGNLNVKSNLKYISPNNGANLTAYMLDNGTLSFEGNVGQLFSITNSLTGTLFSVNDISGIPSIEVQDTGTITMAQYSGNVGIGTATPAYKLEVNGSFAATTKSFVIDHPTKPDYKLRYGSLEGPENGVYVRGRSTNRVIELPDYWSKLVDADTITVNLTPVGKYQKLYVERVENNQVHVSSDYMIDGSIDYFYTVWAERKDVDRLEVEIKQ